MFGKKKNLQDSNIPTVEDLKDDNLESIGIHGSNPPKTIHKPGPNQRTVKMNDDSSKNRESRPIHLRMDISSHEEISVKSNVGSLEQHKQTIYDNLDSLDQQQQQNIKKNEGLHTIQKKSISVPKRSSTTSNLQNQRQTIHAHTHIINKPTNWKKYFYSKYVYIGLHCIGAVIGVVCLCVLPILYIVIPRNFFGPADSFAVMIFIILPILGLGVSYILVTSFGIITIRNEYYTIGYIFNGNPLEIFLYVIALVFIFWVATGSTELLIMTKMEKAITTNDLEPWQNSQHYFECCGIYSYIDWENSKLLPLSCCNKKNRSSCPENFTMVTKEDVWESGCLKDIIRASSGLNYTSLVMMIFGVIISTIGMLSVREAYQHKNHPKHASLFFEPNWMMTLTRGPKYFRGRDS